MILAVLLWQRACALFFFATGHRCVPSALQYGASFVGFDTFDFVRCGAALAGNTYAHAILGAAALPAFASAACGDSSSAVAATAADTTSISSGPHEDKHESCESARQSNRPDTYARMVARTGLAYTFAPSLNLAVTLAFTLAERRHLMMWALFAPKLMYDALALLVGAGAAAMACGAAVTLRSM
jgi:phosphatidylinositol glycan class O